ncbi:SAM dependent carboxyl methyltransferase - like 10 [Theobroma cacao]|nr:SAM dependent carboxyl methyltransferase - like 10 [Theobroma cacao]
MKVVNAMNTGTWILPYALFIFCGVTSDPHSSVNTTKSFSKAGLIEEAKLDHINLPYYAPTPKEVRHVIQTEGSFQIQRLETYKIDWDSRSQNGMKGKNVARTIRAVAESLLENHFTGLNMDDLFERFAKKIKRSTWRRKDANVRPLQFP